MKKSLIFLAALAVSIGAAFAGQEIPIAAASRLNATTYSSDMYAGKGESAITAHSVTTTIPSAATLTLTIQGKTPQGTYFDIISTTTAAASTSVFPQLSVGTGLPATANVSANAPVPPVYRIKSVISGSATYSIGVNRSN